MGSVFDDLDWFWDWFIRGTGEHKSYDEWKAWLEERGGCPHDPSCRPLLTDPLGVINDPRRWPQHLCYGTLEASLDQWCGKAFLTTPDVDSWRGSAVGLPIRRQGFLRSIPPGTPKHRFYADPAAIANFLPFAGDEQAAFVLRVPLGGDVITFFGLLVPLDDVLYTLGPARFTFGGSQPGSEDARRVIDRTRRWWAQFIGQPVWGRPPGGKISAADLHRAAVAVERMGKQPTQERLAEVLDCDPKTLQRAAKVDFGGWRQFRASR